MDLIDREHPTSDDKPPWSGMVFRQRVYSDAMLESLKRRYPQGANLRERKHMAAIEFLQQELREMQEKEAALATEVHSPASTPDAEFFDGKNLSSISPPCSPTTQRPLPAITNECYQGRIAPNATLLKQPPSMSSTMSGQEFVFSVVEGPIVQRRKRKKMTATEKIAYKQMRRVGACDSCKRQKAKCTHVGGATDKFRKSQAPTSISRRESRSVSGARTFHSDDTGERKYQITAAEPSQELLKDHGTSFQNSSTETPVTVTESSQCDQDMQMGAQSDSFGYVPVSASSASYSVSTNPVSGSQRNSVDTQFQDMDYSHQFNFTEADATSPSFLTQGIFPPGNMDPGNFSTDIWNQFQ
ncbi:hypothetical protein yc1106_05857 [Curvularia clavata]|uniref:Uncharacterized protein n=1 Tax=Curvularia clavata TaxID=95742 RepID=A0A9Q8ZD70_CURCL|nr:hypothetical protein yc1106_05857 [Curvularia clavata]